ncbi:MAG: hypothetical protein E6I73_13525 [Chloroflexi bacterium]|nr:MAG: hypothetical protein E6I73_13525 [Chloroflexota bacterium]
MNRLSAARLGEMASGLQLELGDDELTRLLPMVQDLLDVAQILRQKQPGGIDHMGQRERPTDKSR